MIIIDENQIVHVGEFEKLLMVTDETVGMTGSIDQKCMITMMCMLASDIAETYLGEEEESLETCLMACVIGANVASLSLGFAIEELDGIEDDVREKLKGVSMEIIGAAKRAADISGLFAANTPRELREMIGSRLMDELEEYDKDN